MIRRSTVLDLVNLFLDERLSFSHPTSLACNLIYLVMLHSLMVLCIDLHTRSLSNPYNLFETAWN